mmetsp:Transcript_12067/g.18015  ORF Transcript_12067/g.18015 Transcript_12067/m.18015 type:complete len:599 (-) Transcript_12067:245-2041(-)
MTPTKKMLMLNMRIVMKSYIPVTKMDNVKKQHCMTAQKNSKRATTRGSMTPSKRKKSIQTKLKSESSRDLSAKKRRSPLKQSNRTKFDKDEDEQERQGQYNEQWQMLKSMRKRQEVALREAERERETARAWAIAERENTQKWVKEQRALIQRDRHRTTNAAMVLQRKKQLDHSDRRRVAAEKAKKREQEEIDALCATIEKLKMDLNASKDRHKSNEKKLKERIREREEEIQQLRDRAIAEPPGANKGNDSKLPAPVVQLKTTRKTKQTPATGFKTSGTRHDDDCGLKEKKAANGVRATDSSERMETKVNEAGKEDENRRNVTKANQEKSDVHDSGKVKTVLKDKPCDELNDSHPSEIGPIEYNLSMPSELTEEPTEQWFQRQVTRLQKRTSNLPVSEEPVKKLSQNQNSMKSLQGTPVLDVFQFSHHQKPYNANNYSTSKCVPGERNHNEVTQEQTPHPSHIIGKGTSSGRGRTTETFPDGRQVISYRNGTQKEVLPDGTTTVRFANGDLKTSYANQCKETYFYAATQTTHTTHRDGLEIYEFPNKQVEHHYPSGKKEIMFADGTKKIMFPDGFNETRFSDGVRLIEYPNGERQVTRS